MCTFLVISNTFRFNSEWKWFFKMIVGFKEQNSLSSSPIGRGSERERENGDFQSISQYACMHAIVQVTLNDTIGKRIDLFSMLIELYESWLAFETSALMCNDVQWCAIFEKCCGDTLSTDQKTWFNQLNRRIFFFFSPT